MYIHVYNELKHYNFEMVFISDPDAQEPISESTEMLDILKKTEAMHRYMFSFDLTLSVKCKAKANNTCVLLTFSKKIGLVGRQDCLVFVAYM